MEAALRLVDERGFSSLSLREVAREAGIVPTGFYRHFQDLDELGFALVDESFRSLRQMLRGAREDDGDPVGIIRGSVAVLVRQVYEHRLHFRFIARERSSGDTGAAPRHPQRDPPVQQRAGHRSVAVSRT